MAMKKGLCVVVIVMLVVSMQLCLVHSRVLRSEILKAEIANNYEDFKVSEFSISLNYPSKINSQTNSNQIESSLRMVSFAVSSNNSSTRPSKPSLAFRLASGPSKKGRGH
ncbi:hypothetical protein Lal_00020428 [Lupinus albus]|uniref:Uncharacterized protein n=1 Tax=Lupinus albus TaxID=3870 RepID=A0A6A4Q6X6_LUPAL|nr:hypothetical protein Lalb_Chr08g0245411 [Lupinus albus]KAF1871634.1 hypothetical protein Lal_00020428 [Lupinus albus]